MLDHVFVSVSDLYRSIEFYERALAPLGIRHVVDYDGANGPEGHPDLLASLTHQRQTVDQSFP